MQKLKKDYVMPNQIDINKQLERGRWQRYHTQLAVMNARDKLPRPLSVDEMLIQITREELKILLEIACAALCTQCE